MYDVAVVGGGPGGSTCAYNLARKGINVALVDKADFPRQKACGGGLPARVFKSKGLPDFSAAVEAHSDSLVLESCPTGDRAYINVGETLVYQVRRFVLDKTLFDGAVEAGAHPLTKTNVRSFEYENGGVVLKVASGQDIRARAVVGAGGARDLVAKVLRAREGLPADWNRYQVHAATRIEPEVGEDVVEEFYGKERAIWVHFNPKGVRGYGWIFPKKSSVNIGVGEFVVTEKNLNLHQVTRDYINLLEKENLVPPGLDKVKISGAFLPIGGPLGKTYTDNCLLVGDAAGFPSALTGEGMWYALESGRLAADTLVDVLAKGEPTKDALALYERKWRSKFGHELEVHLKWTKTFYRIPTRIVRMAARDKQLVRRSADVLTGNRQRGTGRRWIRTRVATNAIRYSFRRSPRDLPIPGHPGPAIPLT